MNTQSLWKQDPAIDFAGLCGHMYGHVRGNVCGRVWVHVWACVWPCADMRVAADVIGWLRKR